MGLETVAAIASIGAAGFSLFKAATTKAPKADAATAPASQEVAQAQTATQQTRSALLETSGGAAGAVLQPGQVQSRNTLFGN